YRCLDCVQGGYFCLTCIASTHQANPLHHVQRWDYVEWKDSSLKDLGVSIKLGHNSAKCPNVVDGTFDLNLLDISGVHYLRLNSCACPNTTDYRELLRLRWAALTPFDLRYAVSFDLIEGFLKKNYESHISYRDYLAQVL
ncbi:hypothetical protein SCHPADRAFT_794981, partial [Schizopora paradoxa]